MKSLSRFACGITVLMLLIVALPFRSFADVIAPAPFRVDESYAQELETDSNPNDNVVLDPSEEVTLDDMAPGYGDNADALKAVNGMTNILLIGLDARPGEKTGRSDSMILMTLDADHNCIKLTSFMRDLYVEIPGRKNNRLNAAFVFGGPELLMRTLKQNFGVDVDHYVAVNFSSLGSLIDQLGGLTLTVEDKYLPRLNAVIKQDNIVLGIALDDGLLAEAGEQHMTGKQAQAYARYRYGTPDGDAGRTVRQREVVLKCMEKIKELSMDKMVTLALTNMDKVITDMSLLDVVALAPAAFQLKDADVRQLRIPIDGSYSAQTISGMAVYVPNRTKNLQAMTDFITAE